MAISVGSWKLEVRIHEGMAARFRRPGRNLGSFLRLCLGCCALLDW